MSTFDTLGYGVLPPEFDTEGSTSCDLKIPHRAAGEELGKLLGNLEGLTPSQKTMLKAHLKHLDENFLYVERWAAFFFRNCICHCEETGT